MDCVGEEGVREIEVIVGDTVLLLVHGHQSEPNPLQFPPTVVALNGREVPLSAQGMAVDEEMLNPPNV